RTIAASPHWRTIHLMMLAGCGLVIAGIWVRLLLEQGGEEMSAGLVAALGAIALGLAINALNIAFMAGSGLRMATVFEAGDAAMAAVFDVTHPIGLMAARFGNFIVALGALALGWAEWRSGVGAGGAGRAGRRLLATLAWIAGIGGIAGALFFDESSRFALAAVALLSGWQLATGVRAFGSRGEVVPSAAA
ncbi:MAG: hypothetical protein M3373_07415, partial [Gemmatimonadota bacterium]|nr:hypothetical protein [Gemmatimonadota bacterium]